MAILDGLSEIERIHLLLALQSKASKSNMQSGYNTEYVDDIVKSLRGSEIRQHLSRWVFFVVSCAVVCLLVKKGRLQLVHHLCHPYNVPLYYIQCRGEIANAIAYQKMLQRYSSHSHQPPSWKQLSGVMLASGLPFVGYAVMINMASSCASCMHNFVSVPM